MTHWGWITAETRHVCLATYQMTSVMASMVVLARKLKLWNLISFSTLYRWSGEGAGQIKVLLHHPLQVKMKWSRFCSRLYARCKEVLLLYLLFMMWAATWIWCRFLNSGLKGWFQVTSRNSKLRCFFLNKSCWWHRADRHWVIQETQPKWKKETTVLMKGV